MEKQQLLNLAKEILEKVNPKEIKTVDVEIGEGIEGTKRISIVLDYSEQETSTTTINPVPLTIENIDRLMYGIRTGDLRVRREHRNDGDAES